MNRSTIYEFLRDETGLNIRTIQISGRKYIIAIVPYEWESSFLYVNNMRFTKFQSIILFSNEMAVRFEVYEDYQVNIPYRNIDSLEVREDEEVGYMKLYEGKKVSY